MAPPDRFARLALVTTAATYLLIFVGGLVRAAGAGLGCPDWPRCFGAWIPPTDKSQLPPEFDPAQFNAVLTWTEYLNRLLGAVIGLLIVATFVVAWRRHRGRPRIVWPTFAAMLLTGVEGWLGGQVVAHELKAWIVTAHMVLALVIVGLLLFATAASRFDPGARPPLAFGLVEKTSAIVGAFILLQVAVGTLVRGRIDTAVQAAPDLARADYLAQAGNLDLPHRQLGALGFLAVLGLFVLVWRRHRRVRALVVASGAALGLAGLQIVAGLGLAYLAMPRALQVVHLGVASLLVGALTVVWLLSRWLPAHDAP